MRIVEVPDETYERLDFAARVFGVSPGDVVVRLVHAMDRPDTPADSAAVDGTTASQDEVKVHVVYQGRRVSGVFQRSTKQVRVTSDLLAGRSYPSPSAAAIAVVESINPGRTHPNTNGRTFWIIDDTGKALRSIMGQR
jgi:negative regulator of replication initiation